MPHSGSKPGESLTFELLDDLMDLPEGKRVGEVAAATILRIGPLVEYVYHDYAQTSRLLGALSHSRLSSDLDKALLSTDSPITSIYPRESEFIRPPRSEEETKRPDWLAFRKRFENAATDAGLGSEFAKALSSTMREMAENALLHSEAPSTAIVGYRNLPGEFEYVVADAGVGVYRSLKRHQDYENLKDSTAALKLALRTGETRFGRGSGHGTGFNQLIDYIAKRDSSLRFRSGDASLNIEGGLERISSTTRQGIPLQGFLISVLTQSSHAI